VLGRPAPGQTAGAPVGRFVVAGYASRDPHATTLGLGRHQLYQRSAAGYPAVPGLAVVPSPDGRTLALISDQHKLGLVPVDRVLDPQAISWIRTRVPVSDAVWSPDSRRLTAPEFTRIRTSPTPQMITTALVVEAATLSSREVQLDRAPVRRPGPERTVFGPRGDGFAAVGQLGTGSKPAAVLQIWGEQGGHSRVLSVDPLSPPDQPFSPSGRLLAGYEADRSTVVDVTSGAELASVRGQVAGWYDEDRLVVLSGRSVRVVDYRSGRVLVQREIAAEGRLLTGVWLVPARGGAPAGAIVL
jgi:hypothetical protein